MYTSHETCGRAVETMHPTATEKPPKPPKASKAAKQKPPAKPKNPAKPKSKKDPSSAIKLCLPPSLKDLEKEAEKAITELARRSSAEELQEDDDDDWLEEDEDLKKSRIFNQELGDLLDEKRELLEAKLEEAARLEEARMSAKLMEAFMAMVEVI